MPNSEQFLKNLRDALNHLYDPGRLRRSPLIALFGVADRFDAPAALQRILTEAIEALKPAPAEPNRSPNRRIYDLLLYRYVQQFSQQEVANQLGISVRHLRREQRAALEALAYHLWEKFNLQNEDKEDAAAGVEVDAVTDSLPSEAATHTTDPTAAVSDDLAWLKDTPPETATDLAQTLPAVLDLARPLTARHAVRIETTLFDDLPLLAVHPVAARQMILNLLSVAIHRASTQSVHISAQPVGWSVEIRTTAPLSSSARSEVETAPSSVDAAACLDMAQKLAWMSGGQLTLSADPTRFDAALILPAVEQLPVLAVDDNADALQLLRRYTAGTRYRLIGTRDPHQTLQLAQQFSPQIIVLDVMMPQLDGWELLGRLREHPLTHHVPIIVHTILPQEELSLSLGASAFVRKPVTRLAFLAALDQLITSKGPAPSR
jgi:CheY-like chemotaxis protein